jgi:hypothetical protein
MRNAKHALNLVNKKSVINLAKDTGRGEANQVKSIEHIFMNCESHIDICHRGKE